MALLQPCFIATNELGFSRGEIPIFNEVNLTLSPGEILMIRGGNGSGKTSLLRILAGFSNFYSGQLKYKLDTDQWVAGPARGAIGWLGHKSGLNLDLSVEENLKFWESISQYSNQISQALKKVDLLNARFATTRNLSAGQQRRLNLARLLLGKWPVWILDEPSANLDKEGAQLIEKLLSDHAKNGGSAIVASHEPLRPDAPTSFISLHQELSAQ